MRLVLFTFSLGLVLGGWSALSAAEEILACSPAVWGLPDSPEGFIGGSAVVVAGGYALTLQEAFVKPVAVGEQLTLVMGDGRRGLATVKAVDEPSTGVLLACDTSGVTPMALADVSQMTIGSTVWTLGNSSGAVVDDGVAALSRGVLSGRYVLPADGLPMRGRGGRILSLLQGPVCEIDAAVNDGDQGAAVVDAAGHLLGLASLASARERRLGTMVPLLRLLPLLSTAHAALPLLLPGVSDANIVADPPGLVVLSFDRFQGLGNPEAVPRPPKTREQVPVYERERLDRWWDRYYHDQQILWTDSPAPGVVLDPARGTLLTAAANLHGGATSGRVLLPGGASIPFSVLAVDVSLDLAVLIASAPLPLPAATIATSSPVGGEPVSVVAQHRLDAPPTRTVGHVSCRQRRLQQSGSGLLQIDARTNYASLGGAVLDPQGRIVGLVVMSGPEAPWLINSGVTLAVDGATINAALPSLLAGKTRERLPTLGLGVVLALDEDLLVVRRVTPGTGAAQAGIRVGDVVIAVEGRPVSSAAAVSRVLLQHRALEIVNVQIRRHGKLHALPVTLQEFGG
jgi:S1-C subfamily serine protease